MPLIWMRQLEGGVRNDEMREPAGEYGPEIMAA